MRRGVAICLLVFFAPLFAAAPASAGSQSFSYTGAPETWVVPDGVTSATFDLTGASSIIFVSTGPPETFLGGLAGSATATVPVTPGTSVQVNVGGQGDAAGGWNGGGDGAGMMGGSGGGGATDIRIGGTGLSDRILVAGGGGGIGLCVSDPESILDGGDGGEVGGDGQSGGCGGTGGDGGTASSGGTAAPPAQDGSLGNGGDGATSASNRITGGGGGGYYGGGGGLDGGGGGGGSSFGPAGTTFETGVVTDNGSATVSYADPETPAMTATPDPAPTTQTTPAAAKDPKCKRLGRKLKGLRGQLDRLREAASPEKQAMIRRNIGKTRAAQRRLAC